MAQHACLVACACRLRIAGAIAADVFACVIQRAVSSQETQHPVAVFFRDILVERSLVDGLCEQLAHMSAGIIFHLAQDHRLAAVRVIVLQEGGAVMFTSTSSGTPSF